MSDADTALAALAERVLRLENGSTGGNGLGVVERGDTGQLSQILHNLKKLRSELVTASKELESQQLEKEAVLVENKKLRYQMHHLRRALESEEKR